MKKIFFILAIFCCVCVSALAQSMKMTSSQKLRYAEGIISNYYVDTVNSDKIVEEAIIAMLKTLDPHSTYSNAEETKEMTEPLKGNFSGIGITFNMQTDTLYVLQTLANGPSEKVGIVPGDRIISANDTIISGVKKKNNDVIKLLRGPKGTEVVLKVLRKGQKDLLTFRVVRDDIPIYSVDAAFMADATTGYVRISRFAEETNEEFLKAVKDLKKQGMKDIIIDLQDNGGGYLGSAYHLACNFLRRGDLVVYTEGLRSQPYYFNAESNGSLLDGKVVVLVNQYSASASEIVAGALQDNDRGLIVGRRTFGKGLVQSTRPLPYDGLLKVTVAKYYIPSGRLIQALDYSHRNPDGSVARTPDSLTNTYKTAHGRIVRDGGGLVPDITVDWGKINRLVYNIVRDHWSFDFATKYVAENPQIGSPHDFEITDEIYGQFKKFIDPDKFKYDKTCEELVKQLREVAEAEGYMNEETKQQLDTLSKLLTHNLDKDLDTHRKRISSYLLSDILSRYFYAKGEVIADLRDDVAVDSAVNILSDPMRMKKILNR